MSSGQFGPTYTEIRNLNGLSSTEYGDTVIEQHIEEAFYEVQDALKITISTTAQTFTALELNTKDFFFTPYRTIIYFSDLEYLGNRYLPLLTVSLVENRTTEDGDYQTKTEGSNNDYILDLKTNAIIFLGTLPTLGYKNFRITGTYGVVASPMTSLDFKYKKYIALLAAIKGAVYAKGSSFNNSTSGSVGAISYSKDEVSRSSARSVDDLNAQLDSHLNKYGLTSRKTRMIIA